MPNRISPEFLKNKKEMLMYLQRLILKRRTTSRQGQLNGKALIPSSLLFDEIQQNDKFLCTEQMFVQLLLLLKQRSPNLYDYLDVTEKWKNQIQINFPESVPSDSKFYCNVEDIINACDIYDFLDQTRRWQKNEKIWVPRDDPMVLMYIENGMLKLLSENTLKD